MDDREVDMEWEELPPSGSGYRDLHWHRVTEELRAHPLRWGRIGAWKTEWCAERTLTLLRDEYDEFEFVPRRRGALHAIFGRYVPN